MTKRVVGELVFDFDLYPRATISTFHVGEMVTAAKAGAGFPPIIIDKKTKRIADGFHRAKMYLRIHGPEYEVEVIEKSYKTEQELFLDAIRLNADHGLRMDTHDKTHCILRAKDLKIDSKALASALHMDVKRIGDLRVSRTATAESVRGPIPLKRTISHMHGKVLTKQQSDANDKLSGMNQQFYVNQVITLIESSLIDLSDEQLLERLKRLHEVLEGLLVSS